MICYLCNKDISGSEEVNEDHVPQSGFFLTKNPPGIKKLDVHKICNDLYSYDEGYIITHLRLAGTWDSTGQSVWEKRGFQSLIKPGKKKFLEKIMSEARPTMESFGLPISRIVRERLERVLDKITRGLYFSEFNRTIETDGFKIISDEFLVKQRIGGWKIEDPSFVSVGSPGKEEFKYLRRVTSNSVEYIIFFYNTFYLRLLYARNQPN